MKANDFVPESLGPKHVCTLRTVKYDASFLPETSRKPEGRTLSVRDAQTAEGPGITSAQL